MSLTLSEDKTIVNGNDWDLLCAEKILELFKGKMTPELIREINFWILRNESKLPAPNRKPPYKPRVRAEQIMNWRRLGGSSFCHCPPRREWACRYCDEACCQSAKFDLLQGMLGCDVDHTQENSTESSELLDEFGEISSTQSKEDKKLFVKETKKRDYSESMTGGYSNNRTTSGYAARKHSRKTTTGSQSLPSTFVQGDPFDQDLASDTWSRMGVSL